MNGSWCADVKTRRDVGATVLWRHWPRVAQGGCGDSGGGGSGGGGSHSGVGMREGRDKIFVDRESFPLGKYFFYDDQIDAARAALSVTWLFVLVCFCDAFYKKMQPPRIKKEPLAGKFIGDSSLFQQKKSCEPPRQRRIIIEQKIILSTSWMSYLSLRTSPFLTFR